MSSNTHGAALVLMACVAGATFSVGEPTTSLAAGQDSTAAAADRPPLSVEMWGFRFTEPEISLQAPPPDRIVFRVPAGLSRPGQVGAIRTSINGDPAATACQISRVSSGYSVTCDLRRNPQLALRPGRNELRVIVDGTPNEAFFVVFLESQSDAATAPLVARETRRANDTADSEPPVLDVRRPAAVDAAASPPRTIAIIGQASDNLGVTTVTVDGRPVVLRRPSREVRSNPGAVAFAADVPITDDVSQIAVEARDRAGNLTRVLLTSVLPRAAFSAGFSGRKAALIIGVSEYRNPKDGLGNLLFGASDAQAVYDLLVDPQFGGFAPGDVTLLKNEQATVPAVRDALGRRAGGLGPEDLLFIYINTHGVADPYVKDGSAPYYFLLHDTRLSDLPRTGYPMEAIEEIVSAARFTAGYKVILVDTCHSGAVGGAQGLGSTASREMDLAARSLARHQRVALMTSSAAGEVSFEQGGAASGHGVFTLALLEGLSGGADANRDARITAGELFASVSACVRRLTDLRQNPQTMPGSHADLLLATVRVGSGAAPGRCGT